MSLQVIYKDNRGRDVTRSVYSEPHLKEMLEQLRTEAKVQIMRKGKWETIGAVKHTDAAKWEWWYDCVAVMKFFESL